MTAKKYGPTLPISEEIHARKYRGEGESFKEAMTRVADALKDNTTHFETFRNILYNQRFIPAGRVQAAMGAPKAVSPYNCFVSGTIEDSYSDIMDKVKESGTTMRLGGGIGYDFSTIRPRNDLIRSLSSKSSGPVSFMNIYDANCGTIASAGDRRGAQMAVLRVDHPDIEEFITAKNNEDRLRNFNVSVGVTDAFMAAVKTDSTFDLVFEGKVYRTVNARALWDKILRSTWDWAEPGVLFIDRMNKKNNLWYCETIAATNPCGEQPLPPYGACLLGSWNLVKYLVENSPDTEDLTGKKYSFNFSALIHDIEPCVRAMDNIIDRAIYPLEEQKEEAQNKRRMGLGITGLANAGEALGFPYGTPEFLKFTEKVLKIIRDCAYRSSVSLAIEKGTFPEFDRKLLDSSFARTLPKSLRDDIYTYGLRNSHLLSIAPTGTISLSADNISSGIEPVFAPSYTRTIVKDSGHIEELVEDYGVRVLGVTPRTALELPVMDHVKVLTTASKFVDSACSKTCNVGPKVSWEEFKEVYMTAYDEGASGCTTHRADGKRAGILNASKDEEVVEEDTKEESKWIEEGAACFINPVTGQPECS